MYKLKFILDEQKSLCLVSDNLPMQEVYTCYHLKMYWCNDKNRLLIGQDSSGEFVYQFERLLPLALKHQLKLDASIKKSFGFYWNEIFADRRSFVNLAYRYTDDNKTLNWIGTKYILSETLDSVSPSITTWLYNNEDGDIILEVTEMFTWSEQEVASSEEMDRYFEFLKNFKPILKQVIPKKVAEQWLRKAKKWYKIFYDNEQKACGR
ncbi:hypothetical protein HYV11_01250 [Candidatus Dependentiae bacterium]|nr:hypothetical protein [Candidatus Dependentiae bacterium]